MTATKNTFDWTYEYDAEFPLTLHLTIEYRTRNVTEGDGRQAVEFFDVRILSVVSVFLRLDDRWYDVASEHDLDSKRWLAWFQRERCGLAYGSILAACEKDYLAKTQEEYAGV